jgi:hypothetical protein
VGGGYILRLASASARTASQPTNKKWRLQHSAPVNFFVMHLLLGDASAAEFERLFVVALVSNVRSGAGAASKQEVPMTIRIAITSSLFLIIAECRLSPVSLLVSPGCLSTSSRMRQLT